MKLTDDNDYVRAHGRAAFDPLSGTLQTARDAGDVPADEWPMPTPLDSAKLPPFPVDVLPVELRTFVAELATHTQTPADLGGLLSLAVCGAALAKRMVVEPAAGWREPVNLFVVVVSPPAARKSAVFTEVIAPLSDHERSEAQRLAPVVEEAKARRAILEKRREKAIEMATRATEAEGSTAARGDVERVTDELLKMPALALPRELASDATPEALASLLVEQGGRIAVMDAEGGPFNVMAGRYSNAPNFEVYLKGHAGDDLRVDRKNRPFEFVRRPALTVGLAVQPDVVRSLADVPGFRGRGLLGRFLYGIPPSNIGYRSINPPPLSDDARRAYSLCVLRLATLTADTDKGGNLPEHVVKLSHEASLKLTEFRTWLEASMRNGGELAELTDWGGKLAGATVRLAGILHAVGTCGKPWESVISPETMAAGIQLAHYLIPHARAALALVGEDAVVEDARHLLRWVLTVDGPRFHARDALRGTRGTLKSADRLRRALALLAEHRYVRQISVERRGPGRPAEEWERHPSVNYGRNGQNP